MEKPRQRLARIVAELEAMGPIPDSKKLIPIIDHNLAKVIANGRGKMVCILGRVVPFEEDEGLF